MIGQRQVTPRAPEDQATVTALNEGGRAAAVEEQERLLMGCQGLGQGMTQRATEDAAVPLLELLPHVHYFDRREGDDAVCRDSVRKLKQVIFAQIGAMVAFHVRCGAAQDYCGTTQF